MSSLELGRIRNIAKEVFKILNGLSPLYLHDLDSLKKFKLFFHLSKPGGPAKSKFDHLR